MDKHRIITEDLNNNFNVMMILFVCNVHVMCDASLMLVNFLCLSNRYVLHTIKYHEMTMLKLIIAPLRRCFYMTIIKEVQGSM
jgi:hypothetical protein